MQICICGKCFAPYSEARGLGGQSQPEKYGQQCECITVVLEAFDCICYGKKGGRNNRHLQNMDEGADMPTFAETLHGMRDLFAWCLQERGVGGHSPLHLQTVKRLGEQISFYETWTIMLVRKAV